MTKREQYGLIFTKRHLFQHGVLPFVEVEREVGHNSVLSLLIGDLSESLTTSFIYDLKGCLNSKGNIDEGFFSDSVEDMDIFYKYPNVEINNLFTIPMEDMLGLLEEWSVFIA